MFKLSRSVESPAPQRVCVLGVGGGGCRAIDQVIGSAGCPPVAAINTDSRSLAESKAITKIQIGGDDTGGLGAGGDAEVGKKAAESDIEMVRGMFTDTDVAVVVTCLGGGTGSGATPVILNAAQAAGVFTIMLATKPFEFEGIKRKKLADEAIHAAVSVADLVCVIDNDRLFCAVDGENIKETFKNADEALAAGICSLWQILVQPSFIGIDLADLQSLVSGSGGICLFGFGNGTGVTRGSSAVNALLKGPVFDKGRDLRTSGTALISVAGSHDLTLLEVGDVMSAISKKTPNDCNLIMGSVVNDDWHDRIMVSAFVTDRKRVVRAKTKHDSSSLSNGRRTKKRIQQDKLRLDISGKGRFKNVAATVMDGQDLDIPTYIRLRIELEK